MATSNYNLAHSQNKELGFNDFVNNKRRFEQTAATIKYYDQLFTPHEEIARLINCKLSDFEDLYLMAYANSPSDFSKTGEFSGRDQKLILLLHKTGKTLDEISHTLGCSHGKAIWQIHKLFLDYQTDRDPKSPFTSEDLEAFEHLAFLEVPIEQVAEQLNCSESEAQRAIDEVFLSYNSKREKRARLWLHDRIVLQHLKEIGISQRQIAEHLNCSPAAITYELKRCPENEYNAYEAHKDYLSKLHQERGHYKIEQTREFLETFSEEFNKKECSPESFAKFHYVHTDSPFYDPSRRLCANTLYKYIHEEAYGLDQSCLAYGFKEEKSTIDFEGRQHKRLNGKSITEFEEPEVHNGIPEFFVWEIDSIIGTKEKGQVILNIIEQHTHMSLSFLLDSKTAACVNEVIHGLYTVLQGDFKTVFGAFIPDNGTEFCQLNNLAEAAGCIYFARPYTPTDKPQVERLNRQHRQYFQKGESMEDLTPADIYKVMTIINNKPVKSLNWATPSEYFNAVLAQINTQLDLEAIALYVNETSGEMRNISPSLS